MSLWLEFLEITIHSILYHRNVYPKKIFQLKKKYNIPVHVITHSGLNQYITDFLKAAASLYQQGQLDEVHLQISDDQNNPLQTYVFRVIRIEDTLSSERAKDPFLLMMENVMKACLLKLSSTNSEMPSLPDNSQFELVLKLKSFDSISNTREDQNFQKFQWIPQDEKLSPSKSKIVAVENIETNFMQMEIYIEDSCH